MSGPSAVHKVVVYVTSPRGLLVFDEPDFPEVALQVPGGTVEPGEPTDVAAARELLEETGIRTSPVALTRLGEVDHRFAGPSGETVHHRTYFHLRLPVATVAEWIHLEATPMSGGAPIRFRLHWIDPVLARETLGYGFAEMLDRI